MKNKLIMFTISLLLLPRISRGAPQSSVTQYEFTWTFDADYEVGRFANGDYWVVGPVTITAITPTPADGMNGSMVNPTQMSGVVHAYDSRMGGNYDPTLLVQPPVTLGSGSSLISTYSHPETARPQLQAAAVLTVVGEVPPADAFRPPYVGTEKPMYRVSQLRRGLLPDLDFVSEMVDMNDVSDQFERVWLEHYSHHSDGTMYTSPTNNMPNYGREYSTAVSTASLLLMLNEAQLRSEQGTDKTTLLTRLVQLGIDLYEITEYGGYWFCNGGLNHGRKWPILFAGIMLDHTGMRNIGSGSFTLSGWPNFRRFQEDCQTYVDSAGNASWAIRNCNPSTAGEEFDYNKGYRICCTSHSWLGFVLAARMMCARELWNHDALFGYTDRWVDEQGIDGSGTFPNAFIREMWRAYRDNLPECTGTGGIPFNGSSRNGEPSPVLTITPNPMRYTAEFISDDVRSANASVVIYGENGMPLRHVEIHAAGRAVLWDGLDDRGRSVMPGLYFYTWSDGGTVASGKIVKIR